MPAIAQRIYTAAQVRRLEQLGMQHAGIPAYTLMTQAGQAVFDFIRQCWATARSLCVVCGAGNNAGDGYVVARLALQAGWHVQVIAVVDPSRLGGAAQQAFATFRASGGQTQAFDGSLPPAEVMVDALLGIGLARPLRGEFAAVVAALNAHSAPVVAVDIPSGLHADTGQPWGNAVQATATVTFIGMKVGLLTGQARDYCGQLHVASLAIPEAIHALVPTDRYALGQHTLWENLPARRRSAHKGSHGHTLLVGGAPGMSGAIRLAGEAALRAGSGLVSVATHPEHAALLNITRPELMVQAIDAPSHLRQGLQAVDAVAIGPGLGQHPWGRGLLSLVLAADMPKVLDADALNLLAQARTQRQDWILTPHPGEAARLLGCSVADIEQDREAAARRLQREYGGVIVLKGAGTLVASARGVGFCLAGNPGMASAGMGDTLTGIIAGLLAQGLSLTAAAETGVWVHAHAADVAALQGERGLLASDLLAVLRAVINGKEASDE